MKKSILFLSVALMTITLFMSSSSKPDEQSTCPDRYTLACDLVEAMKKKYEDTQLDLINKELNKVYPKGDAKAVWLSLSVLEEFICQIKEERADGIRFYYAAYPIASEWDKYDDLKTMDPGRKRTFPERHTLLLIPTLNDVDLPVDNNGEVLTVTVGSDRRISKNHGSLFPPKSLGSTPCP